MLYEFYTIIYGQTEWDPAKWKQSRVHLRLYYAHRHGRVSPQLLANQTMCTTTSLWPFNRPKKFQTFLLCVFNKRCLWKWKVYKMFAIFLGIAKWKCISTVWFGKWMWNSILAFQNRRAHIWNSKIISIFGWAEAAGDRTGFEAKDKSIRWISHSINRVCRLIIFRYRCFVDCKLQILNTCVVYTPYTVHQMFCFPSLNICWLRFK